MAYLPAWLKELFKSDAFKAQALSEFNALCDEEDQEGIDHDKLFPVVVRLSATQPIPVTEKHCQIFARFFDWNKDGILQRDEFHGFVTFLWTASFLSQDSPEALRAKSLAIDTIRIKKGQRKARGLLEKVRLGRRQLERIFPHLP